MLILFRRNREKAAYEAKMMEKWKARREASALAGREDTMITDADEVTEKKEKKKKKNKVR